MKYIIATIATIALVIFGIVETVKWNDRRNSLRGRGDAETATIFNEARDVYQMPDRFGNVSMFCDKYNNAIYVTTIKTMHTLKDGCE